jgi:adenosylcobyric acid synthase
MLGRSVADPDGVEGPAGTVPGLGLLDVDTVLTGEKRLARVTGRLACGAPFAGYEIHMGRTDGLDRQRPVLHLADGRPDGATSADGLVRGSYVHGLFHDDAGRAALLRQFGAVPSGHRHDAAVEATLDDFADHLEAHVAIDRLLQTAR